MKITFVIPLVSLVGGIKVVFEYANNLQARGHEVRVVYPLVPAVSGKKWYDIKYFINKILRTLINIKKGNVVDWFDLKAKLSGKPTLDEIFIPDGDIVVATSCETSYYVSKYNKNKGIKFYLIQGYETWCGEKNIDRSYKLGLHNIVISTWLKNLIQTKIEGKIEDLIINGIDFTQFYPEITDRDKNQIRILMPYRDGKAKGFNDGLKAFEIVRNRYNNVKLVLFGVNKEKNIPENVEIHKRVIGDELRHIYNSCDIFLFPSQSEGFGLPPMEAMACGCAVVTTNVGAVPDYAIPGKTALVSAPGDPEALAQNVIQLIENKEKRKQIAENGYNYVKQFTWDKSTDELEKIFKRYIITK